MSKWDDLIETLNAMPKNPIGGKDLRKRLAKQGVKTVRQTRSLLKQLDKQLAMVEGGLKAKVRAKAKA